MTDNHGIDVVTTDGIQTLTNKTFAGATAFVTNGDRIGVTSDTAPIVPTSLIQVVNNAISTGLRVSSTWEGSAAAPFQNHDNSLWETFNRVIDDSLNLSWSISAPNAYNDIPFGVRDAGERVGVYGWATSVNVPDLFVHAGTLASQIGVRGRAGFQGMGTPETAIIESAVGIKGEVFAEAAGATIQSAFAGRFTSLAPVSTVVENTAVYAAAAGGSVSNWSFFSPAGQLFNQGRAYFGVGAVAANQSACDITLRGNNPNSIEFGNPSVEGYGSNIGATAAAGVPFLGLCCEADAAGNTFTTRGRKGTVIYNDLLGNLVFARIPEANASGQTLVQSGRFDDAGNLNLLGNLAISGSALLGTVRQSNSRIAVRQPGNNIEFGHPNTSGYGSNLGATTVSGLPFLAFNAEADGTGNTFTTRGRRGVVVSSDINGSLVFSRVNDANAAGQTLTQSARFDPEGRLILSSLPTYADNAAAVAATLGVGTVYKTATGELRVVV